MKALVYSTSACIVLSALWCAGSDAQTVRYVAQAGQTPEAPYTNKPKEKTVDIEYLKA